MASFSFTQPAMYLQGMENAAGDNQDPFTFDVFSNVDLNIYGPDFYGPGLYRPNNIGANGTIDPRVAFGTAPLNITTPTLQPQLLPQQPYAASLAASGADAGVLDSTPFESQVLAQQQQQQQQYDLSAPLLPAAADGFTLGPVQPMEGLEERTPLTAPDDSLPAFQQQVQQQLLAMGHGALTGPFPAPMPAPGDSFPLMPGFEESTPLAGPDYGPPAVQQQGSWDATDDQQQLPAMDHGALTAAFRAAVPASGVHLPAIANDGGSTGSPGLDPDLRAPQQQHNWEDMDPQQQRPAVDLDFMFEPLLAAMPDPAPVLPPPAPAAPALAPASPSGSSSARPGSSSPRPTSLRARGAKGPKEANGRSRAQNAGIAKGWAQAVRFHQNRCRPENPRADEKPAHVHAPECKVREHPKHQAWASKTELRDMGNDTKGHVSKEWAHLYAKTTDTQRKPDWKKREQSDEN